jgi:hypothetical protein
VLTRLNLSASVNVEAVGRLSLRGMQKPAAASHATRRNVLSTYSSDAPEQAEGRARSSSPRSPGWGRCA